MSSSHQRFEIIRNEKTPLPAGIPVGTFGMWVFLASISMLFFSSIVAYVIVRADNIERWYDAAGPGMPRGLWLSTALAVAISVAIQIGLKRIQNNNKRALRLALLTAFALALLFLLAQIWNWYTLVQASMAPDTKSLYSFTFYMLTSLHALHVIAGLAPLGLTAYRAWKSIYSRIYHRGVHYNAMYWHFLTAMWFLLFSVLQWGS